LTATVKEGDKLHRRSGHPAIQGPYPFGAVQLVSRKRNQVCLNVIYLQGNLPEGLSRIRMQQYAPSLANATDLSEGLHGTNFIMSSNDAHQDGPICDRFLHMEGIHEPAPIYWKIGNVKTLLLETATRIEDRMVFDGCGNDVVSPVPVSPRNPLKCHIVRFGGPRRENNLHWLAPDEVADLLSRLLDGGFSRPPEDVSSRRGIAKVLPKIGEHCLHDFGVYRGRGMIIHVNRKLHIHPYLADYLLVGTSDYREIRGLCQGDWDHSPLIFPILFETE
jgi:hypothetical protein